MRLVVIPKNELSAHQLRDATQRIYAPEHACDVGTRHFWDRPQNNRQPLALFDRETDEFVGAVYCVITPPVAQDFTWWLDSRKRKKGYWRALADELAQHLKKRHRIEKIGFIVFGTGHREASQKIAQRLREHFDQPAQSRSEADRGSQPRDR